MGRLLFGIFTVIPIIEIVAFILVGQAIGFWPALLGILVTAVAGSLILRLQGRAVIADITSAMREGRLPARELGDAMLIGFAGVLLLTPGYFTDILGILLLIPPVRSMLYRWLQARVTIGAVSPQRKPPKAERGTIDLDDDNWRER
ncbi:MAG: FxsA protein [Devosia sp.]|nr:FxsA protein [Devosia sp.]